MLYFNDVCEWICIYGVILLLVIKLIIYSKYGNYIIKICGIKKKYKKKWNMVFVICYFNLLNV